MDKKKTIRIVKMNDDTLKIYEEVSNSQLTLFDKNLRNVIKKSELNYEIEPIISFKGQKENILEYNSNLNHKNGYLGLVIDPKLEKYFIKDDLVSFINDGKFNKYRKLETDKDEYTLIDYRFRVFKETKDKIYKIYPANSNSSYFIERYYPLREMDAKKTNAKLKKDNLDSGLYIEVDKDAVKGKYKKYVTSFDKHVDNSYMAMTGHLYLLPYLNTHSMPRATKKLYLTLIKYGEAVGTKARENGTYDILPYNKDNTKELKKYNYNLSYVIPPVVMENFLSTNTDKKIETMILEATKVPGGYHVQYFNVKNFGSIKH